MAENTYPESSTAYDNRIFTLSNEDIIKEQNGPINNKINNPVRSFSLVSSDSIRAAQLKCGYGKCTPKFVQFFHNSKCLLVCLCFCSITQGMLINGFIPVSLSSVEKRFQLSSTHSGIYASMYDIAVLIALIPVCHYGGKGHKGKWLGIGMFIMGIGSLICALPQFITGTYQYGQSHHDGCLRGNLSDDTLAQECIDSKNSTNVQNYFYVLLLGQFLNGIGAAPLYTLGITYIDENVAQKSSPLYLGVYFAFSVVGPALGFVLGGIFLGIFGDFGKVDLKKVAITKDDPSWYGAWWLGMVLTAIMSLVFSVPLLGFARELPEARRHRKKDINQTNKISLKNEPAFGENLQNLPKNCWALLKNRTYSCLIVMKCCEAFLMNGMVNFIPKLVENLFSLSSSAASLITGAVIVPGGFLGNVIGGYVIKRFKLRCAAVILLACACQCVSLVLILSMLIYCPEGKFVGVNAPARPGSAGVLDSCNKQCHCSSYYKPVCHEPTTSAYFSACHAGCTISSSVGDKEEWSNCRCINATLPWTNETVGNPTVVQGLCRTGCNLLAAFLAVFGFQVLVTFTSAMPIQQAELRCVPFKQRTLAVSLSWVFIRIFGSIPGSVFFGMAIDNSCSLWKMECGEAKACIRYTSRKMALAIMSFGLSFKSAIVIFLLLAWKFYRSPDKSEAENDPSVLPSAKVAPIADQLAVIKL